MKLTILFLALALTLQGVLGELVCEELSVQMCSFSISSSGKRCLLETFESDGGKMELQCKTSEVMVGTKMNEYIESEECVSACGIDRNSIGISSDSLLDTQLITFKLCSPQCYNACPNIVDLYYNLALAEGVLLPELCKSQRTSNRRSAIQLQSSGAAASAPISATAFGPSSAEAYAPTSSETFSSVDCAPAPL